MLFRSVEAYVEALQKDHSLAMIPMGMVAEFKGITRSAVSEQIKAGQLESISVKGRSKTWKGVTPKALFAQAARIEGDTRERRAKVLRSVSNAAVAGRLIPYSEVMEAAGLSSRNPRHRGVIGALLTDLSQESWREHGFLVSCIVIQKASGRPNGLFFELARTLGALPEDGDPDAFWQAECLKLYAAMTAKPKEAQERRAG
ncbi:hypothetical protein [Magnetospirillum sp. UT-4]|uniref:hypothetical protein n=1 Tax=Magnetospirillum sp. UT-4 TaxID=2681467 RepID=UPI0013805104|nr:hypothetical protein [Magnetospirillum sp. UT-4]CAA7616858.1 hypothetical protein MTBUT4_240015 [Magnetospirillum sp. UT-4]